MVTRLLFSRSSGSRYCSHPMSTRMRRLQHRVSHRPWARSIGALQHGGSEFERFREFPALALRKEISFDCIVGHGYGQRLLARLETFSDDTWPVLVASSFS